MSYTEEFNTEARSCHIPAFLLKRPWEDISWHNDTMPCFCCQCLQLKVWVDFDNPSDREFQDVESYKYLVGALNSDDCFFETNSEESLKWFIETYGQPDRRHISTMADLINSAQICLESCADHANKVQTVPIPYAVEKCSDRLATLVQELADIKESLSDTAAAFLTFKEFQATGKNVDSLLEVTCDEDFAGPGRVYAGNCYIEGTPGDWCLTIANESWASSELEELEWYLYEFYCVER